MKAIGLKQCVSFALAALVASAASSALARNTNGTWQVLDAGPAAPSARKHHTMVYDSANDRVILFGGETEGVSGDEALADVWALHLTGCVRWEQLVTQGATVAEIKRHGHQAIYVGSPPRMIIFGGRSGFESPETSFLGDVWSLSLTGTPTWTKLSNAPPTGNASCAGEPFHLRTHGSASLLQGQFLLFGGRFIYDSPLQDAWGFNLSTNVWSHRSGATSWPVEGNWNCDFDNTPEFRYWHSSIVDDYGRMVVFGGKYEEVTISTAWATSNGSTWTKVGEAPTSPADMRRLFHIAVYDPVADRMIMHGGYNTPDLDPITNTVSTLNLPASLPQWQSATWTMLSPSGTGPGYIAEHAGVYSPSRDWMVVFGGSNQAFDLRPNTVHVLNFNDNVDTTAPATATLTGTTGRTTSTASWAFPGDDGNTGTACRYEFRRADFEITAGNFSTATLISSGAPPTAGTANCVEMQGQIACRWYWYALKTWDDSGNVSGMSTISMKQKCNYVEVICEGLLTINVPAPLALEYRIAGANPGNGQTTLAFTVPADLAGQTLDITVFDVAGRRVRTLEQRLANTGSFTTSWDHRGADGKQVAVGMYFAKLQVGASTLTQKILVAPQR